MAYVLGKDVRETKDKYWINYIRQRISKNKNFLGFVSGPTGSGKSFSTLKICQELDPNFSIERCVFTGKELMDLINSDKLKKGSAIAFEEVGVEMSNRNWQSVTNKMINYLLQTFRHRNIILIMNSVYMDFIDAHTRKLFHAEIQTQGIDLDKKEVILKPQLLQYNSRMQKFYYKRLKVLTKKGKRKIKTWRVGKPSEDLLIAYEKKKREYTDKLNKKIYDELTIVDDKTNKKSEITMIQQDTLEMLKQGKTVKEIAIIRKRPIKCIQSSMVLMKKKGYQFNPVRRGMKILKYEVIEPNNDSFSRK